MLDESTEETADIVTVTLQQESAVEIAIRKLQAGQTIQDGAINDLAGVVSDMATGEMKLDPDITEEPKNATEEQQ